jgi:non-homologous end joining protein Ku
MILLNSSIASINRFWFFNVCALLKNKSMLKLIQNTESIKNEITDFIKKLVSNKKGFNAKQFYDFYESKL